LHPVAVDVGGSGVGWVDGRYAASLVWHGRYDHFYCSNKIIIIIMIMIMIKVGPAWAGQTG
jgi:hypothetical protein